ncbi:hypothetical protein [Burkholderia stagnalis]|uniref:hypothetical protein n=1 Tax=Burkholderia stagnalis TaxID=1503054 RepID=UPI000F58A293|nr:hypothetical protein [Burkholderia stagnalis]RQQ65546.1 hypothetical protein DF137_22450 [Burkholderia stagnalis]RQQ78180.1 hypothetical protein DF138_21745 [Burkholderia stagnalis]RQQ87783.1 hypothetical protein DF136_21415 [Burkholderia stagnalis]
MILRPQQVRLLAMGLPATPANKSSDSSSSSNTTNNYEDKRNAVQNGIGVSGDNNLTSYSSYSVTTDGGAVTAALDAMKAVAGAVIGGNNSAAQAAINGNSSVASQAITSTAAASNHLEDVGLAMLQANTALANSLMGGAQQNTQAVTQIASDLAKTQIASQNDNRYLIAAGLAVVCIVGVMAFSKG